MAALSKRRCLALWFPYLPCERAWGEEPPPSPAPPDALLAGPSPEPRALVSRSGNAMRLVAVNHAAALIGLAPGMMLADARARHPALPTLPHEPADDALLLERLARAMRRFTPMVAPDPPDGLLLDITGCAHLFGGEAELAMQAAALTRLTTRHALADNAAAARALARYGSDAGVMAPPVMTLPVTALELDERATLALRRAGLSTLGDLARRPIAALAARLGEAAVLRLRQIIGDADSPIAPLRRLPTPREEMRFAEPLGRVEDALDATEELLIRLARQLEQRGEGLRQLALALYRSDGQIRRLNVETGLPTRDPALLMRLLRERIDTLADPLDPGFGFDMIRIAAPRREGLVAQQESLDRAKAQGAESLAHLLDRLATRWGAESVLRLHPHDSHIPERAQYVAPVQQTPPSRWPPRADDQAESSGPRPLWLFEPPQPVTAMAEVPDGPPQRFRWRGQVHEVLLAEGPERIAGEWWRRREGHLPGGGGLTRDYYRIEDSTGRRYWLFRHGLYDETPHPRWYLHGLFA